ncbi:MAG TPA: carbohydrate kinase family protein [Sphaerochaeta sp.]|nr:carbohydrate kinase family protein [Sphaerochaeta sp.]HQB54757.1 carbohydrate kinase family protein [Sphaerochaeta sp.]
MKISAIGCCLIDYLFHEESYSKSVFNEYRSVAPGDGGLLVGGLVFGEQLAEFTGSPFDALLRRLIPHPEKGIENIGGPAIISLIHVAQLLHDSPHSFHFHGVAGDDTEYRLVRDHIAKTVINPHFLVFEGEHTPTTYVLNDSHAHGGKGERTFVNLLGSAAHIIEADVSDDAYRSDIVLFGGTALWPAFHTRIDQALRRAKAEGALTIVGTVFDFMNEHRSSSERWPFGQESGYPLVDLLVCDALEAERMSGQRDLEKAAAFFDEAGVGAGIITHGSKEIVAWSKEESIFGHTPLTRFPVCTYIDELLEKDPSLRKDTTGCGDNFLGGVIASIIAQGAKRCSMVDTIKLGGASGGFALTYHGGMFHEAYPGEKRNLLDPVLAAYGEQLGVI